MKKLSVFVCAMVLVFGVVGKANSALQIIGTAQVWIYSWNLIYEDDSIDGGLVWWDYSRSESHWLDKTNWAESLSFTGSDINLLPGYTTNIDWSTGWRLPADTYQGSGYNLPWSEMGHLYYESLGNPVGGPLGNTGPFNNLQPAGYWSGTPVYPGSEDALWFSFNDGYAGYQDKLYDEYAMAVHPGTVSFDPVPIPSAIWLLGSAFIGLIGFRRKFRKA